MTRKEFISLVGVGSGAVFLSSCLGGCSKSGSTASAPTVDFTLDLTQPANNPLNTNGGYIYSNGLIVARTATGSYIAVSQACTHEGTSIQYDSNNARFHCPNHGANFNSNGIVINGPATQSLKRYSTTLSGNSLHVKG